MAMMVIAFVVALAALGPAVPGPTGSPLAAQSHHPGVANQVTFSLGVFDVLPREEPVLAAEFTYRVMEPWLWRIAPQAGAMATSEGSVYGYGGFYVPVPLGPWLEARPLLGVGAYATAAGLDLGHVVAFRSGVTLAIRLPGDSDISIAFYHLSNAWLSERNPGAEVLGVGFSAPLP